MKLLNKMIKYYTYHELPVNEEFFQKYSLKYINNDEIKFKR